MMDKFDSAIIAQLRINARTSISDIANKVNLSRSAVTERIKKLEKTGIIKGYHVALSESQKQAVQVYFEIKHQCAKCSEVVPLFRQFPEVITCHGISGEMDLIVHIKADNMNRVHELREYLDCQEDIVKIKTHVVMSEWINNL